MTNIEDLDWLYGTSRFLSTLLFCICMVIVTLQQYPIFIWIVWTVIIIVVYVLFLTVLLGTIASAIDKKEEEWWVESMSGEKQ